MNSLWTKTVQLPSFSALNKDLQTDVLVIGGGIAGLLCADRLRRLGLNVVVAEADTVARGVSARTTAKITTQQGGIYHRLEKDQGILAAKRYYAANREAMDEYRAYAAQFDFEYKECDALLYSTNERLRLSAELAALRRVGGEAKWADKLPISLSVAGALRLPCQAQMNPLLFIKELLNGLTVYEHTRVREIHGHTAVTDGGNSVTAQAIIVATHFPFLNCHGGYFLKLYQHRSYVIAVENAPSFDEMLWSEDQNGITLRRYGKYLLIGGGGHRTGKPEQAWKAVEDFARQYFPEATIKYRWATQDCMSLDGVPYVGRYSKSLPAVYVATGFNGWGMTGAMTAALLLAAEIGGKPKEWATLFEPSRRIWHAQLAVNAGESVLGLLTPRAPRCPHLGCALKWNPFEHSWDCGCHGSRFAEDGRLLNGPATDNLTLWKKKSR